MVYRQRPFAGWRHVRWWWLAGLLGWLACGLASRSPSLTTAVLAILAAAVPSIARGTPRVAVGLVGDRLTEWYPLGRTVATRLDDIEQVDVRAGRALCFAEGRVVVLDESLPGWREMADALRAALRPDHDQSASAHLVTPRVIEHWLGVAPGGTLAVQFAGHRDRALMRGLLYFALTAMMLAAGLSGTLPPLNVLLSLSVLCWLSEHLPAPSSSLVLEARASGQDLDLRVAGGWRRVAWSELTGLVRLGTNAVISSTLGTFLLPHCHTKAGELCHAVERAVAAKERGAALPRLTADVPPGALSRAAPDAGDAEHGLSRID